MTHLTLPQVEVGELFSTDEGKKAIQTRQSKLSARQRQFLLLIDKSDEVSQKMCAEIARKINVEQLIDLGLVTTAQKVEAALATSAHQKIQPRIAEDVPSVVQANKRQHEGTASVDTSLGLGTTVDITKQDKPSLPAKIQKAVTEKLDNQPAQVMQSFEQIQLLMVATLHRTSGLLASGLMQQIQLANDLQALRACQARWRMTLLDSKYDRQQINSWVQQVNAALHAS